MNVEQIVNDWLKTNGYDGLYSEGVCSCVVGELEPCGEMRGSCESGYKQPCTCGEGCDFDIGPERIALEADDD